MGPVYTDVSRNCCSLTAQLYNSMLTISRRPAIENGETAPLAQPSGDSRPSGIGGTETPFLKPRGDHEPCPCNALEMLARSVVTKRFRARHRSARQIRLQNTGETTMTFGRHWVS